MLATNTLQRAHVLRKGGSIDKFTSLGVDGFQALVRRYCLERFTFDELNPDSDVTTRGVNDLPNYHYRDDAIRVWTLVKKYCADVLALFYVTNTDVTDDTDLRAWIDDLNTSGFAGLSDRARAGLPRQFYDVTQVVDLVARVMFTLTARHSATHIDALDLYGFVPDVPGMMRRPPPTGGTRQTVTRDDIAATLPDQYPDAYYASLAFVMQNHKPNEVRHC